MGSPGSASARGFAAVCSRWGRGCRAQPKARRCPRRCPAPTPLPPAPARAVARWRQMEGPGLVPVLTSLSPSRLRRQRLNRSGAAQTASWDVAPGLHLTPEGLGRDLHARGAGGGAVGPSVWGRGSVLVVPWVRPAAPSFQPGTGPCSPTWGLPGFAPRAGLSPLGEPSEAAAAAEAEQLLITHVQQREKNAIP